MPVDYSQRAVEVEFPADAPATYEPGQSVTFDISSWSMSTAADVVDTEVEVRLGSEVLGTAALNNTVSGTVYDQTGTASVAVTVPADQADGPMELTLVGAATGSVFPVIVEVAEGPAPSPIVNRTAPSVVGDPMVGRLLTALPGTWDPSSVTFGYQWLAGGVPIAGASGPTLRLTAAQAGALISVRVTASAPGHAPATATSGATATVVKGDVLMNVKVKPKKIKVNRKKAKVKVNLVNIHGVPVTGTVTVKAEGQKAQTAEVVNGKVKVKLKRFTSTGEKTVKVVYSGSAALRREKETVVVTVRR